MIKEIQLRILPEEAANEQALKTVLSRELALSVTDIHAVLSLIHI